MCATRAEAMVLTRKTRDFTNVKRKSDFKAQKYIKIIDVSHALNENITQRMF